MVLPDCPPKLFGYSHEKLDAKNKSQSSPTVTVECVGDVNKDEALKVLPYHIYYPDPAASQSEDVSGKAVV